MELEDFEKMLKLQSQVLELSKITEFLMNEMKEIRVLNNQIANLLKETIEVKK